jgi:hypothetical protein
VARLADRVLRMEAGRIVAPGPAGPAAADPQAADPLDGLTQAQVRAAARAALAAGLGVPGLGSGGR